MPVHPVERAKLRPLLVALATAALLAAFYVAPAQASVTGYAEPAFTKTNAQNTYWWNWQGVNGLDSNGNSNYYYYLCLGTIHNGVTEESPGNPNSAPNNCDLKRSSPSPSGGNAAYSPYTLSTILQDGHTYQMCAYGYYANVFLWALDNASLGNCPSTTIDRNKPTISVSVDGAAQYTNNPVLALRIDYSDSTSPPWFGQSGIASNWGCINLGGPCAPGGSPDNNCSARHFSNSKTDYFDCSANATNASDGDYFFCARSADAGVLDNPSGTNQFIATSASANISDTQCGHVVLDRAAPTVSASANSTSVTVGTLVNFTAAASDGSSGVPNPFDWDFGDNTQHSAGTTTSHTYTQAGTYQAKVATTDGAGNPGQGTVTITVNPPASTTTPGGTTPGGTTPGGTTPGGTTPQQTAPGTTPVSGPVSPATISQQAGGGGTQTSTVGGLQVLAPKKFRAGRKQIVLALTPNVAGKLQAALLKGTRVLSRKGAVLPGPGTYMLKLKVSKKLKPGRYLLKLSFQPAGSATALTKTLRLKVLARRGARHKVAANRKQLELHGSRTEGRPTGVPHLRVRTFEVR